MLNYSLYKEPIKSNLVLISGLTRSGKSLLCPIVSSFENTEKVNANFFLEQIPFLNSINKISDESSIYLLKTGISMMLYDNAIGRNVNFRNDDFTSIWKYRNPSEYTDRLSLYDGEDVIKELENKLRLFPLMVHNGLPHANLWFGAYPALKMIHMQRNPIDIVYSWNGKGYGGDFYSSKRSSTPVFNYKGFKLPYFAFGWEEKYSASHGFDRIIYSVNHIRNQHKSSYEVLDDSTKERILFVSHKKLTTETDKCLSNVSNFLGTWPSDDTPSILLEQNCPRVPFKDTPFLTSSLSQEDKLKKIRSLASSDAYEVLISMCNNFNSTEMAI